MLLLVVGKMRALGLAVTVLAGYCGTAWADTGGPETIGIAAGPFVRGSDRAEREAAYGLDESAYGHSITRKNKWYESEFAREKLEITAFDITRTLITNRQYADFIQATGHRSPDVDGKTWRGYGLIHPYHRTRRHAWLNDKPPPGREHHPVVLVSHADARAYAKWLSRKTGRRWRLPSEIEWEKAARGTDGRRFPWGDKFDAKRANSADFGPFDTVPVGLFPAGASPFGLLDAAGQVFEWTSVMSGKGRYIVKGGSWDDKGCGICRPAARHSRPENIKHILIGFRLVRESR
jgi:formylglycine-generating enzyme required for sulfatase activity